jgi:hypothetical protein
MKTFKTFIKFIFVSILILTVSSCTEAFKRKTKDLSSNFGGGLYRKVSVYDYNGNLIKTWKGKFDTQMGDQTGVPYMKFDIPDSTGRNLRVMIQGGIIINEEI